MRQYDRRGVLRLGAGAAALPFALRADTEAEARAATVLATWLRLALELVRHTAIYSPPVASRAFAYLGIAAWEACAEDIPGALSLAGQVPGLDPLPPTPPGAVALRLNTALKDVISALFVNTGPTGQRSLAHAAERLDAHAAQGLSAAVAQASRARGAAIAAHVLAWAASDGGAEIVNMGFPRSWPEATDPAQWVPTSAIRQQQVPLLPLWGANRTFAVPQTGDCGLLAPPDYSEEPGSAFHQEALEVCETGRALTDEQKLIARFWSDDPMLSPTPPGHWISILMQIAARDALPAGRTCAILARLGIAMADAFIVCWRSKYEYDLLRPVTYIRRVIDPDWSPLLITPPFPEYPSGHSTQSGAATAVLTAAFGDDFAFDDATHDLDGLPVRSFASFDAAAQEAALSRLYGGIHFRAAIARGLEQGACVGAHANALRFAS